VVSRVRQVATPKANVASGRDATGTLRDEIDFERYCNYIHFNRVKHGHVSTVSQWPHSSFQRFVRLGMYPLDRAAGDQIEGDEFGER